MAEPLSPKPLQLNQTILCNRLGGSNGYPIDLIVWKAHQPMTTVFGGNEIFSSDTIYFFRLVYVVNPLAPPDLVDYILMKEIDTWPGDTVVLLRDERERPYVAWVSSFQRPFLFYLRRVADVNLLENQFQGQLLRTVRRGNSLILDESSDLGVKGPVTNINENGAYDSAKTSMARLQLLSGADQRTHGVSFSKQAMALVATEDGGAKDKSLEDIMSMLSGSTEGSKKEIEKGSAPMPQNIVFAPPYDEGGIDANYKHLINASSMIALWTSLLSVHNRTKSGRNIPYDITNPEQAVQAFNNLANSAYQALTEPLSGIYNVNVGSVNHFRRTIKKAELHYEFLHEIFKSFALPDNTFKALDGILTEFVKNLGTINFEQAEESADVCHSVLGHVVERINITGDGKNPKWVYQPKTKLIYLRMHTGTFKQSIKKLGMDVSKEQFDFEFYITLVEADLNVETFLANREKYNRVMNYLIGKNLDQFGQDTNKSVQLPSPAEA
ncbi:hypothetical protein K469DRAFT_752781 [Zopfia rhizophila CBS 207.26]|uniref:Uncharacterized protein n=1 Tax=Zopfia rhizophila CBS 207.26 TaxID=1314779 RepID=A0A6A6DQ03_9PEZI|nr:hypothetical protein K469DRAFT_752781 [Zopfia rhizophila CBS 207.26]